MGPFWQDSRMTRADAPTAMHIEELARTGGFFASGQCNMWSMSNRKVAV